MLVTQKSANTNHLGYMDEAVTLAKAVFAVDEELTGKRYYRDELTCVVRRLPAGWKGLGEGCFRMAVRAPSGIVYKVSKTDENDRMTRDEAKIFLKLHRETWIPMCTLYEVENLPILAVPFLENDGTWLSDEGTETFKWMMKIVGDLHEENFVVINGRPIGRDIVGYYGLKSSGNFCGTCLRKHSKGKHTVKPLQYV